MIVLKVYARVTGPRCLEYLVTSTRLPWFAKVLFTNPDKIVETHTVRFTAHAINDLLGRAHSQNGINNGTTSLLHEAKRRYHTLQLSTGTIAAPFLQLNAAANPGWFTIAPFARKWSGECPSVSTWFLTCSGRAFSHQFCAKPM